MRELSSDRLFSGISKTDLQKGAFIAPTSLYMRGRQAERISAVLTSLLCEGLAKEREGLFEVRRDKGPSMRLSFMDPEGMGYMSFRQDPVQCLAAFIEMNHRDIAIIGSIIEINPERIQVPALCQHQGIIRIPDILPDRIAEDGRIKNEENLLVFISSCNCIGFDPGNRMGDWPTTDA